MSQHQRRTFKRYNESGHAHFLTFSCWKRLPLLSKDRSRHWFLTALRKSLVKYDVVCWAYVIMPEHVHLVVYPRQTNYDLGAWLASLKLSVTKSAIRYLKVHSHKFLETLLDVQPSGRKTYHFWQPGGGVDVNLWTANKIWDKIDYNHNNPVRRRLVENPQDWKWSSYRDHLAIKQVGEVPIDFESLPVDMRRG